MDTNAERQEPPLPEPAPETYIDTGGFLKGIVQPPGTYRRPQVAPLPVHNNHPVSKEGTIPGVIRRAGVETKRMIDLPDEEWKTDAACRGISNPEDFFSDDKRVVEVTRLKFCAQCIVRNVCLEYALKHDDRYGLWGNMSKQDREKYHDRYRAGLYRVPAVD